jgi:cytoskeletal protein CcmA (bactofilin family)
MWNQEDTKQKQVQPGDASGARADFGRSIVVKGEIKASEDLTIDGTVEGRIDLPNHVLTVGPNATITADITVRVATTLGSVVGNVIAHEKLDVRQGGSIAGTVSCGRLIVQDGANVNAKVETKVARKPKGQAKPDTLQSVA